MCRRYTGNEVHRSVGLLINFGHLGIFNLRRNVDHTGISAFRLHKKRCLFDRVLMASEVSKKMFLRKAISELLLKTKTAKKKKKKTMSRDSEQGTPLSNFSPECIAIAGLQTVRI